MTGATFYNADIKCERREDLQFKPWEVSPRGKKRDPLLMLTCIPLARDLTYCSPRAYQASWLTQGIS